MGNIAARTRSLFFTYLSLWNNLVSPIYMFWTTDYWVCHISKSNESKKNRVMKPNSLNIGTSLSTKWPNRGDIFSRQVKKPLTSTCTGTQTVSLSLSINRPKIISVTPIIMICLICQWVANDMLKLRWINKSTAGFFFTFDIGSTLVWSMWILISDLHFDGSIHFLDSR